jgi:murein DD-endopeptidase MepM/ murein hydrolase activator NlpD
MQRYRYFVVLFLFTLASCSGASVFANSTNTPTPTALPPTETLTPTPAPTSTPTVTPTPPVIVYSPLDGLDFDQLNQIISNPFKMPDPEWDDGHPGVDLAFYDFGDLKTMVGLPIHAVLGGTVAAVVDNRNPYGNMMIIETPLTTVPSGWVESVPIPTLAPTQVSNGSLTCPDSGPSPTFDTSGARSLYLLYAHMENPPQFKVGDAITADEVIGNVGDTGQSSGPHLHFETRIGPADARFTTIAHKDTSATPEEMYNYCVWRISFWFEPFDPLKLLKLSTLP